MIRVTRHFFNIGQGAFYLERIGDFNIVYDCGSVSKNIKLIKKSESTGDPLEVILPNDLKEIDKLFISHFHEDHINKINDLLKKVKVKEIYFPVLDSKEDFYSDLYLLENISNNPNRLQEIFETYENLNRNLRENKIETIKVLPYIEKNDEIHREIPIASKVNWQLIIANLVDTAAYNNIKKELCSRFETIESLKEKIKKGEFLDYSEIQKIYKKHTKNLNDSSMVLYSGIDKEMVSSFSIYFKNYYPYFYFYPVFYSKSYRNARKVSAFYTGDLNLKKHIKKIKEIYKNVWTNIKIIQIPHHGSKHNFSEELVENKHCITVISCGIKNRYNHPCINVVNTLKKISSLNIVTEYRSFTINMYLKLKP